MKTEAEQAQAMAELITNKDLLDDKGRLAGKVVFGADQLAVALVKAGYGDVSEYKAEIEQLKDNHAKLQELFAKYQLASDKEIRAQVKQAKIDVLNEFKQKYGFYSCYAWSSVVKSLTEIIDELIKEVENEQ